MDPDGMVLRSFGDMHGRMNTSRMVALSGTVVASMAGLTRPVKHEKMFYDEPDDCRELAPTVDLSGMGVSTASNGHHDEQSHPCARLANFAGSAHMPLTAPARRIRRSGGQIEESSDEDICMVSMDQQLLDEGVNCGVVQWVDAPWPDILQRCLARLWEMYQEQNFGRVKDQQAHDKEVVKLKKEIDFLSNSYSQLVEDVSKLFDYQDGKMSHDMDYTSEAINKKKKELEDQARIEISMEKLKLAKEQRCILQSQADIIQNMRKAMKEVQVDRDLLKEEKKKLEYLIADLLKAGHCTKEKMERIKAIVDE
ncbi:hypothetical protein D1007_23872 [Hordeum vulgare]|nr:hypothetical protein D1007_23872 [Hordeum vulgare]